LYYNAKITETPRRRRMMFMVARTDAFSVSVWKRSVTDSCRVVLMERVVSV